MVKRALRSAVLERVERLATDMHGPGTAISIDREAQWIYARVWDAKGQPMEEVGVTTTRTAAKRDLVWLLVKSLLGLALLTLTACGPSSTYHGASSFTPAERAQIEAAAAVMSDRTGEPGYTFVWDDGDDGDNRILREHPPDEHADGEFLMSSKSYARTIYLAPHVTGAWLDRIAEHEFGHSFGLPHHHGRGLMNSDTDDGWTQVDVDACRELGKCRP